jgi:hypothetical protein
MKCFDCNGRGGWGHTSPETDLYGRTMMREAHESFYNCPTCHGMGNVTEQVYSQSKMAEDERYNTLERELGYEAEQFAIELDRERAIEYLNQYNQ